jgi:hypothetical protein
MTVTYLTGTRYPGTALKKFVPDYLDLLAQRGETILTTNKPGVDALILEHCNLHHVPLQVIEFACDSGDDFRNRRVRATSAAVQVQRVVSPSWLRFRHLADKADKVIFFHAAKTKGRCYGISTIKAFELACKRRGVEGQQLIIQRQHTAWVSETELRNSPTIGAAHIYVYARFLPGLDGERHSIGYYRVETWRKIAGIVQPGEGRREIVIPNLKSKTQANLHMLHQVYLSVSSSPPGYRFTSFPLLRHAPPLFARQAPPLSLGFLQHQLKVVSKFQGLIIKAFDRHGFDDLAV